VRFTSRGETVYGIIPNAKAAPAELARTLPDVAAGASIRPIGTDAFALDPT
jgi:hypothetical protein